MQTSRITILKRIRTAAWLSMLCCIAGMMLLPANVGAVLSLVMIISGIMIVVLGPRIRKQIALASPTVVSSERSLMFVLIAALAWGIFDAFMIGLGLISIILFIVGISFFLHAITLVSQKNCVGFKLRLYKAVITSFAGFASFGVIYYGKIIAPENAEKIISAVQQFQIKKGHYPNRLEEIVPEFIPEIPIANYSLSGKFKYKSYSVHSLTYVESPFSMKIYTFEDAKWTQWNYD